MLGPDRVLLPVAVSPHGLRDENGRNLGYRVKPLLHATGWIVAQNGGVDLKNSQALTDHCPVRFPDGNNPFLLIAGSLLHGGGTTMLPAAVVEVDPHMLLYGATPEALASPCGERIAEDLRARYEPVYHRRRRACSRSGGPGRRSTRRSRKRTGPRRRAPGASGDVHDA